MVDALAPEAEEGRGKLRKAAGRSKHLLIRGCPNRETVPGKARQSCAEGGAGRPPDRRIEGNHGK